MKSREIDAQIAEQIMGWERRDSPYGPMWAATGIGIVQRDDEWHPSTNIADAWQVVDKLNDLGWLVTVKQIPEGEPFWMTNDPVAEPNAKLMRRAICELYWVYRANKDRPEAAHPHPNSYGDTAPEAICLAALKAVGVEVRP